MSNDIDTQAQVHRLLSAIDSLILARLEWHKATTAPYGTQERYRIMVAKEGVEVAQSNLREDVTALLDTIYTYADKTANVAVSQTTPPYEDARLLDSWL